MMRRSLAVLGMVVLLMALCLAAPASAVDYEVRKMVLNETEVSLRPGDTFTLKVDISPFQADHTVTWESSDESVVTVQDGLLTGMAVGTATVTVTSVRTPSVYLTVSVLVAKPVESITLADEIITLPKDEQWEQIAYVMPADATLLRPEWSTSDRRVATVDENGVITAVGNGFCTITCSAADRFGAKAEARVQVRAHEIIIREPGEYTVDFEMPEDEGIDETVQGTKVLKDSWKKTVTFENGRLQKASDTSVIPLSAGSEIIHLREIHNKVITKESRHYVYIAKSAVREAGSVPKDGGDGDILFRDIPWGVRYKEVKTLLSSRQEKLRSPIVRNGMLWTQIEGEVYFGDFQAYRNGLSFTSSSANVENLTANLQKTAFCKGDYYFDKSIPFENLKLNVMRTYGLPDNETTSSDKECLWERGDVRVRLLATSKFNQLQIEWLGQTAADEAEETAEPED